MYIQSNFEAVKKLRRIKRVVRVFCVLGISTIVGFITWRSVYWWMSAQDQAALKTVTTQTENFELVMLDFIFPLLFFVSVITIARSLHKESPLLPKRKLICLHLGLVIVRSIIQVA
jgi:hypothetical protein